MDTAPEDHAALLEGGARRNRTDRTGTRTGARNGARRNGARNGARNGDRDGDRKNGRGKDDKAGRRGGDSPRLPRSWRVYEMTKPSDAYRLLDDYLSGPLPWQWAVRLVRAIRKGLA